MSLMQLLTNGKTLVDLKNSTSRYQMPGKLHLPKFGSAKNPFRSPMKNQPAQGELKTSTQPKVQAARIPAANLKETQRLPELSAKMKETKRLPFVAARHSTPTTPQPKWWETFLDSAGVMLGEAQSGAVVWRLQTRCETSGSALRQAGGAGRALVAKHQSGAERFE